MMMMQSIAQEYAPHRIRVNSIAPGAIRTPINKQAWDTQQAYQSLMTLIPYRRTRKAAFPHEFDRRNGCLTFHFFDSHCVITYTRKFYAWKASKDSL